MIRVRARGLDSFVGELEIAEERLTDGIRDLERDLAKEAASDARNRARSGKKTGASMDSIRAMGPVITAGEGVPWYGFADFGGRVGRNRSIERRYIKGGRWLFPAVRDVGVIKEAEKVADKATKGLQ